jgi:hypothetical protein
MKTFERLMILFLFLTLLGNTIVHSQIHDHQMEGHVIRSYAINLWNTEHLMMGTKSSAGDGKVYFSGDGGNSWMVLNNNKPLSDSTEDVQAVAFLNDSTYLAGCWKTGLYRSDDRGASFQAVTDFPSRDIRAIKVDPKQPDTVYLATTTSGVIKSEDGMKSWIIPKDTTMASWDLEIDRSRDNSVYALPFSGGVAKSKDGGGHYKVFHKNEGEMAYDMKILYDNQTWAVGGSDSSRFIKYRAFNGAGWSELKDSLTPSALFSAVEAVDGILYLGSWDRGLLTLTNGVWDSIPEIESQTITKIDYANDYIYVFTWGNGVYRIYKRIDPGLTIGEKIHSVPQDGMFWKLRTNSEIRKLSFVFKDPEENEILRSTDKDLRLLGNTVWAFVSKGKYGLGEFSYEFDVVFENGLSKSYTGVVTYKGKTK